MNKLSLRLKLAAGILLIGTFITLITSAIHVYWDYQGELEDIERQFSIIENGTLPILDSALWSLDHEQVQLTLRGITSLPKIQLAEVYNSEGLYAVEGDLPQTSPFKSRTFTLQYHSNQIHDVGELVVYASFTPIYQTLRHRAGLIFSANALRTLLLAIFLALFFDYFVTRHLRTMARYFDKPIEDNQFPLALKRHRHKRDELDELSDAVNHLYTRVHHYHKEIAEEKDRYYALVENNPEAIWRCGLTMPIPITQDDASLLSAIQTHAILAEVNQATINLIRPADSSRIMGAHWTILPFLAPGLWQALVQNQFQVKNFVSQFIDADGKEHYFSNSLTCLIADQQLHNIWGIAIDITARIKAQQELEQRQLDLRASKTRLAEAQALAHMGHWAYNTENDSLQVSDEFARIYGFHPQQDTITWSELIRRIHPDDRYALVQSLANINSTAVSAEHRIIWPTGEERHVQALARKHIEQNTVRSTFGIIMDITERRRAEAGQRQSQQALIESEARMAEAQAIAHMGHWILDKRTQTLTCSNEFYRLYGHQPQEFPANIRTFVRQIHPHDRDRIKYVLNHLTPRASSADYRIIRPDGEIRYMRSTITPFYANDHTVERVFGISLDITERKLAEMELQSSQELFTKAFESSPDGIVFIDNQNQNLIEVNRAFVDISGYDEPALIGHSISMLDDRDQHHSLSYVLTKSEEAHNVEIKLQKCEGTHIICLLSWRRVDLRGRPCTLAMLRDITSLRALQQTAEQQQKQLLRADQLASLGTMVAGVAHEINNPNYLIHMNAELLESFTGHLIELAEEATLNESKDRPLNGMSLKEILITTPELIDDIKASSRRIDRIVKDLKDFSRPRDHAEYAPTNLNEVITKARNLLAVTLDQRSQKMVFNLHHNLPMILGDSQQLEQVIVNLVTNALDASAAEDTITIRTYVQGQEVGCDVIDHGCGISSQNLKHIFDPFFTTKQEIGGTGLGLPISFRLIREHKGQLEALSELGKGTIMRILLPVLIESDCPPATLSHT